jgi:hypothetical protein
MATTMSTGNVPFPFDVDTCFFQHHHHHLDDDPAAFWPWLDQTRLHGTSCCQVEPWLDSQSRVAQCLSRINRDALRPMQRCLLQRWLAKLLQYDDPGDCGLNSLHRRWHRPANMLGAPTPASVRNPFEYRYDASSKKNVTGLDLIDSRSERAWRVCPSCGTDDVGNWGT